MVDDCERDYLAQPFTRKVLDALARVDAVAMPQVPAIVDTVSCGEALLDFAELQRLLREVFETCVVAEFARLVSSVR